MRLHLLLLAALTLSGSAGCSRFISEGKEAMTGASGQFADIQRVDADAVLDPLQQVIMRLEAGDGATLLSSANITGRSTGLGLFGRRNLAKGCAKGIVKWLKQYTPADEQQRAPSWNRIGGDSCMYAG